MSVIVGAVSVIVMVMLSVSAVVPSVAWTTRVNAAAAPPASSSSMSSASDTVIMPVPEAIAKALVPSPSSFSLPLEMDHVMLESSPVVTMVATLP